MNLDGDSKKDKMAASSVMSVATNPTPLSFLTEKEDKLKYWRRFQPTIRKKRPCKICGRPSVYSYYTVKCCEGCKQFFRRLVVNRSEYLCRHDGNCPMQIGNPCSGCRLDHCLLAGMQPQFVSEVDQSDSGWRQFLASLEARRKKVHRAKCLQNDDIGTGTGTGSEGEDDSDGMPLLCYDVPVKKPTMPNVKDWRQLNVLMLFESRQKRIWDEAMELPHSLHQFDSTEQLIKFPGRLVVAPKKPQKRIKCLSAVEIKENATKWPPNETLNFICIDALLSLEWLRSMPNFMDLELNDQLVLLRHVCVPFAALFNAFYSVHAGIWTRKNGYTFCPNSSLAKDQRLKLLSEKIFCKSVGSVQTAQIDQETFVLLLGILCCDSNAVEQSAAAREHLYNQSVEYCRILMAYLQQHHGNEAGAKRFAECMHLLAQIFQLKYTYEEFTVYRAMVIQTTPEMHLKNVQLEDVPRALRIFF